MRDDFDARKKTDLTQLEAHSPNEVGVELFSSFFTAHHRFFIEFLRRKPLARPILPM